MTAPTATYEIDAKWTIVRVNSEFCRAFRSSEAGLIGRDIRDLLRDDWRMDFRTYVARALVGIVDTDVTLPMVAPCGEESWFKHLLEPIIEDGALHGYRATVKPHVIASAPPARPWWKRQWRAPQPVWNFDAIANAS